MEKFYIVTEKSRLRQEWFEFLSNKKVVNEIVKRFIADYGIESSEYYVDNEALYIIPTEKDEEKFSGVLGSAFENGLRKFKANTKIGKAWVQLLKDENLRVLRKPMAILYFKSIGGKFRSRLFDQDGVLYCSIEPARDETPEGFLEIKASDFYKVIEESETVPA